MVLSKVHPNYLWNKSKFTLRQKKVISMVLVQNNT